MDFSLFLRPEMITALSVSLGALLGGVVAVIAEFRRPDTKKTLERQEEEYDRARAAETEAFSELVREECEHVNRSVWIVEKRLAGRLHGIETRIAALETRSP